MNTNSTENHNPTTKYISDFAVIAFLIGVLSTSHAYIYKLGKYQYYGIPSEYFEVGLDDLFKLNVFILAIVWAILVIVLYFHLLTYELQSKTRKILVICSFLLLILTSICLSLFLELFDSSVGETFVVLTVIVVGIIILALSFANKDIRFFSNNFIKVSATLFSGFCLLFASHLIFQSAGQLNARNKRNFYTICENDNLVIVGKSGDKIIAKEFYNDDNGNVKIKKEVFLISSNCNEKQTVKPREETK